MPLRNFVSKIVSYFPGLDRQSIRREFRHAFRISTSDENSTLNEKELALISRLITIIQKRKLTTPATLFLDSAQPLNYIGSQLMVFFRPFLTFLFTPADYDLLQGILEKREGMRKVIEELEKRQ